MLILPNSTGISPLVDPVAQLGDFLYEMWDAERSDLITVATGVSSWAGCKGLVTVTQGTAGSQPVWSATSFGGRAGVTFDGTDDQLTATISTEFPSGSNPVEIWALVENTAPISETGTTRIIASYGQGTFLQRVLVRDNGGLTNSFKTQTGDGSAFIEARVQTILHGRYFVRCEFGSAITTVTVNNRNRSSTAVVPSTTNARMRIGARSDGSPVGFWQGSVAALLITKPLPSSLVLPLAGYLQKRRRL